MGIPSYFSYIIKNHPNIIRNLYFHRNVNHTQFTSLYMDCNSIIYDSIRHIDPCDTFESKIIDHVIAKIKEYVHLIQPSHILYIAFDGVAPFAKMDQQRLRRYKTSFLASLDFVNDRRKTEAEMDAERSNKWNTAAITPGTTFMATLAEKLQLEFGKNSAFATNGQIRDVVVSPSTEPGEGEHKMFAYLREHSGKRETVAIYGLDSDLIMLSIFHCFYCYNIHIFRESPEFSKSILPANLRDKIGPTDPLFLDTFRLSQSMLHEMGVLAGTPRQMRGRIYDYVFMCFLLGNDFLPHFLALNIRTAGIQRLMDVYANVIGKYIDRGFIDDTTLNIQWKWVSLFVSELAKNEHKFILEEFTGREKLAKHSWPKKTPEERETLFQNSPIILRTDELFICPTEMGWESRYYRVALDVDDMSNVSDICRNYCEGLEWTFRYYTVGCPHWRWKYAYDYPPLLVDLAKYLEMKIVNMTDEYSYFRESKTDSKNRPFLPEIQLAYVIPKFQHGLLNERMKCIVSNPKYNNLFPSLDTLTFKWIGCRYFWESHAVLPEIGCDAMEEWEKMQ